MFQKGFCCVLCLLLLFTGSVRSLCLETDGLSAASAVLYCPESGQVLLEKNAHTRLSMASTTKIMTALLALEEHTPKRAIEITAEMVNVEGSSAGLQEGDVLTLEDIVYCMLLESGNDAANAAAIAIAGSFEQFADRMNARAAEIGMLGTSFVTPSGLDDDNHYTTAYDMALLTAQALENADFAKICSATSYRVEFLSSDKVVTLYNHNRLLESYDGCIGVKTGYTKKSGRCLVSAAKRGAVTLIAVTLNAPDDWNDHKKLLDSGFAGMDSVETDADFTAYSVPVAGSGGRTVGITGTVCEIVFDASSDAPEIERRLYLEKFLYAPVKKGDSVGFAQYLIDGKVVKTVSLVAARDIAAVQAEKKSFADQLRGLLDRWRNHGGE